MNEVVCRIAERETRSNLSLPPDHSFPFYLRGQLYFIEGDGWYSSKCPTSLWRWQGPRPKPALFILYCVFVACSCMEKGSYVIFTNYLLYTFHFLMTGGAVSSSKPSTFCRANSRARRRIYYAGRLRAHDATGSIIHPVLADNGWFYSPSKLQLMLLKQLNKRLKTNI